MFSDDNNFSSVSCGFVSGISTSLIIFSGSLASLSTIGASVNSMFGA